MKYTPAGGYVQRCKDHLHHSDFVEGGSQKQEDRPKPVLRNALTMIVEHQPKPKRKKKMAKRNPFVYNNVTLVRVVDGDTVRLRVDLGFHLFFEDNFRLADIDTPEVRGAEKAQGLVAKGALETMIAEECEHGDGIKIQTYKEGKFGRWLTTLISRKTGDTLNQRMITEGYAKPYGK